MRLAILVALFLVGTSVRAQDTTFVITAAPIVKIIQGGKLNDFVKLVHSLKYKVIDSTWEDKKTLDYIARLDGVDGNHLSCSADKTKINMIIFSTRREEIFTRLKNELVSIGFKAEGLREIPDGRYSQTQDFIKGNTIVATAVSNETGMPKRYEFTFLLW